LKDLGALLKDPEALFKAPGAILKDLGGKHRRRKPKRYLKRIPGSF